MPLAMTRTNGPWTHTSHDSYMYQLSLVVAIASISYWENIEGRKISRMVLSKSLTIVGRHGIKVDTLSHKKSLVEELEIKLYS